MQLLTSLLLLIVVARLLGHLFTRWGAIRANAATLPATHTPSQAR